MALIKCPDCGKDVSDRARACIHCGCPIAEESNIASIMNNMCVINGREYDLTEFKDRILMCDENPEENSVQLMYDISKAIDGMSIFGAASLTKQILATGEVPRTFDASAYAIKFKDELVDNNVPRCPRCNSTSITTGARGYSIISGWFGSGSTVNRCANCGHRWRPRG